MKAQALAHAHSTIPDPRPEGRAPVVLQVLPRFSAGGVEWGAAEVAACLARRGWTALVASERGGLEQRLRHEGGRHVRLPLASKNPGTMALNVGRLARLIESEGVDIVHARSRAPAWSAYFAARRTGRPFITTFHGTYFDGGWFKRRYSSVMLRGEPTIVISQFVRDEILAHWPIDPGRLRLIPRGVDLSRFDPAKVAPDRVVALARQWRLPDGVSVVMMPARLARWKGHEVLIQALAKLARHDLCCVMVGEADRHPRLQEELMAMVRRLALEGAVRFVGRCDDMPAAYLLADVVVSASIQPEAFGRVIVEAQAMGRPVIASAHGGAGETIVHGETGFLIAPNDAAALAECLAGVLALNPDERKALVERAAHSARSTYATERMCERTLAVYDEVLRQAVARAP